MSTLNKAITLQNQRSSLVDQYRASGGTDAKLHAELQRVSANYVKARQEALKYGTSVAEWEAKHKKAAATLETLNSKKMLLSSMQGEQDNRSMLRQNIVGDVASIMAVAAPVRSAISFESAMADAAKTIDGMRDETGALTPVYYEMEAAVKSLGSELPLTHDQIASLFAAGGQQGMTAISDLREFATMAAQMAVAFGMSNDEAADAIGGYRTALGLSFEDTRSMLDLMNQYANTSSASEKGIADIVRRIGSLGQIAGVSAKPMTALAATLDSMKIAPEVAATGIKNMLLSLTAGSAATKSQREAFAKLGIDVVKLSRQMQKDGPAAVISVLEAVKRLPEAEQLSIMSEIFGKESIGAIAPLLKNLQLVRQNLEIAGDESQYAGAMQQEFANRSKTTANNLVIMKNRLAEMGITLGSVVLPALNAGLDTLGPYISAIADFAGKHQTLTTVIVGAAAGFMLLGPVVRAGALAYSLFRSVLLGGRAAIAAVTTAQWGLNAAFSANPIGIAVTAVAALVAGLIYLYQTCEPVRAAFDAVFGYIGNIISSVWQKIKGFGDTLKSLGKWAGFGGDDEEEAETVNLEAVVPPPKTVVPPLPPVPQGSPFALPAPYGSGTASPSSSQTGQPVSQGQLSEAVVPPPKAAVPPLSPVPQGSPCALPAPYGSGTASPSSSQAGQPVSQGQLSGTPVTANFSFQMSGIPDRDFAERVVQAIQERRSEFEQLLDRIVRDQQRAAYGV
ncbi:phage tail tape measure protein [Mailhella massiliensis]|uniref:Phage tail tape measure protein n=1 Tax=Mailhella massiliensis TaxID=1903261 RepID=A0A921DRM8_9BACT|nr:phage tail tape measure protein [Mailhella massiliensis]HJD97820.1 phage tail tape measure protein [Mailhella massiliensis]